jgi:hypothetical protein
MTVEEAAKYIGPDMAEEFAELYNSFDSDGKTGISPASNRRELKADQEVVVLEMPPTVGSSKTAWDAEQHLGSLLCFLLSVEQKKRKAGQVWSMFIGHDRPHVMGLSLWLGFSKNVPGAFVRTVQAFVQKKGIQTGLENGTVRECGLLPFMAVSDDGVEMPPEEEFPLESTFMKSVGRIVRRRFRLV